MTREELRAKERARYALNKDRLCARRREIRSEHHRQRDRAYARINKERVAEYQASYRHQITRAELKALREQHRTCVICGSDNKGVKLSIDHDHDTGEVRGLLCKCCNWGLGHFRDSPVLLHKAAMYLLKFKTIGEVAS